MVFYQDINKTFAHGRCNTVVIKCSTQVTLDFIQSKESNNRFPNNEHEVKHSN